ncbi:MAG: 16S rRNA (guanine(966)-N(2))-methyltransferase RsmD [Acidiferrobacterales bacterium]
MSKGKRKPVRSRHSRDAWPQQTAGGESGYPGRLRIIGGKWRRQRLLVPAGVSVRPTPDRVRETLFNWLGPWLPAARCIDLFAGTGALCLEALSRGAASAVMVESSPRVATVLRENVARLGAENAHIVERDAVAYLQGPVQAFDIVFIDPPFDSELIAHVSRLLDERGWINPGGLVYVEAPRQLTVPPIPNTWELLHSQVAGHVGYHLARNPR